MKKQRDLLRAHDLVPNRRLGQNFLIHAPTAAAIAAALGGTPHLVLEIGPGLGALTHPLLEAGHQVIAIEKDPSLHAALASELAGEVRLKLICADALDLDFETTLAASAASLPWAIAGNLPYNVTGALLERMVHCAPKIGQAVAMVQREVAERLLAEPGTPNYGALTVFVQAAFHVTKVRLVRAGAFHPAPKVDSAVVHLQSLRPARATETPAFRQAVKNAFGMRRKTLRNAWRGLYGWSLEELSANAAETGISLDARGETLAVEAFAEIAARAPTIASEGKKDTSND